MNSTKCILLADDDSDDRYLFREMVENLGNGDYSFFSVEDGSEVFTLLSTGETLPNLIVLDQNMPKMTGLETLTRLKSSLKFRHIPVIIYSTLFEKNLAMKCEGLGAELFISKPETYDGYRDLIKLFFKQIQDSSGSSVSIFPE